MAQSIRVTVSVEIETAGGDVSVHRQTLNNVMSGGNPIFFAKDAEIGLEAAAGTVVRAIAEQYSDVRQRATV